MGGVWGQYGGGGGGGVLSAPHLGLRTREKISLYLTYGVNIASEMK